MKKLILLSLIFCLSLPAMANHILGSDISYKQIDSLKYVVTIAKYRLCSGVTIGSVQSLLVSCSSGSTITKALTRVSIEELKLHCSTNGSECSPQNTQVTGHEGVERHLYSDTIDFASTTFSSLATCSSIIRFAISECCRPNFTNANAGGAATQYYNFAELNLAMGNSSVDLTSDPNIYQCCSQPVYYNMGARDTIERDSISYSFAHSTNVTYFGGYYAYNHPFDVFYPGSTGPPLAIPSANPPIGIYLDPVTGDLIFTPTSCNEVTPWVIEATEWRKDTAGTPQIVGKTRRDVVTITSTCSDNNVPLISGPYYQNVCEGDQLCFNITTSDQVFTPPPPTSAPAPDTVLLTWNDGIPGASFTILDTSARLKIGRFCWTPPAESASDLPYTFTAMVDDNHCDKNRRSYRAFRVRVKQRAETAVNVTRLSCGWYDLNSQIDSSTFKGIPVYNWVVLDSNSDVVLDKSTAFFKSTNNVISVIAHDSLKIQREGVYILRHIIKNAANCTKAYYDTLSIGPITTTLIGFAKDTTVCAGSDMLLTTATINASGPIDYQWHLNDSILVNDTLPFLDIKNFQSTQPVSYKIQIAGADGCDNSDAIKISSYLEYQDTLTSYHEGCFGDTILISLDSSLLSINWSNGSSSAIQSITQSEYLRLTYTDSFGCVFSDSTNIVLFDLPQPNLDDSAFCGTEAAIYPGDFDQYAWNTGSSNDSVIVYTSGTYSVVVTDSNTCKSSDSVNVTLSSIPFFSLGNDTSFCGDTFVLLANGGAAYLWNTGKTTHTEVAKSSNIYWLKLTDSNSCSFTDSIEITLLQNTNVPILTRNGTTIYSDLSGSHQWFINANLVSGISDSFISIAAPGNYTAVHLDSNGCVSDTSNSILKTAGITKIKNSTLKVYPNPTNGQVTIDAAGLGQVQSIKLYDAQGKLVENTQAINGSIIELIWAARSGVLWIVVETESAIYREQIITLK
jgi:hypothetical protein